MPSVKVTQTRLETVTPSRVVSHTERKNAVLITISMTLIMTKLIMGAFYCNHNLYCNPNRNLLSS